MARLLASVMMACLVAGPVGQVARAKSRAPVASATAADCDIATWVGRTLVRDGQPVPQRGLFVLEKDIPAPRRILQRGMASDTVFVSNRITIVIDDKMIIVQAYRG